MEEAAKNEKAYEFTATFGKYGAFIDKLNGTENAKPCYWFVYVETADGTTTSSQVGVSELTIKDKESLVMKFEKSKH